MSFGRPSNTSLSLGGAPPQKGSFPLDHEGECKDYMVRYLKCMKQNKQTSTDCRHLSKEYLACRMDKGLMERTEWDALGFQEQEKGAGAAGTQPTAQAKHTQPPSGASA
ncbi:hypothetical protein BMF94_6743 [Rhodotorula taiwanensis]|uniref:CHCH domain-containing protein n=1 Tax=Rhodotorula taiwanensis TaxID=741276 RepID=A0A2S5B051_9BASI|nr:hypothetical protein BMF94_6743 [Rhodotorula taiwanensis]